MTETPYQPVIQVILLKNQEYLIAQIEEREESPECLLTNPYRITDLTYWDHSNVEYKNVHNPDALFIEESVEKETDKDGTEVTVTQSDYILLQKFPKYTNQTQIYMRADDILTICDPTYSVLEYYQKTVG
jgi:spore coat polysaccharide biosynthesis protein SpsF (cytidylyltransferase family)